MCIELRPLADCDGGHREDGAGKEDFHQDQLRRPPQPQHGHSGTQFNWISKDFSMDFENYREIWSEIVDI